MTKANERFLLHNSGADDPKRFFIFATDSNLIALQQNTVWCIDSTFKVCPNLFYQVWTIHAIVNNAVLPLVYVFMTRKTEDLYNRVLDALCNGRNLEPDFVVSDFEQAALNSFRTHFPTAHLHGCFFHFAQSIWRHLQGLGCRYQCISDEQFVKMMVSFTFIRSTDVIDTFTMLQDEFENDANNANNDYMVLACYKNLENLHSINQFEIYLVKFRKPRSHSTRSTSHIARPTSPHAEQICVQKGFTMIFKLVMMAARS